MFKKLKFLLVVNLLLLVVLLKGQDTTKTSHISFDAMQGIGDALKDYKEDPTHDESHRRLLGYWKFDTEFIFDGIKIKAIGYCHHSDNGSGKELVVLKSKTKERVLTSTYHFEVERDGDNFSKQNENENEPEVIKCILERKTADEHYLTFINGMNKGKKLHCIRITKKEFEQFYKQFSKGSKPDIAWRID